MHRGALDELEAFIAYHGLAAERLASVLADRGDIAQLTQFATHDGWGTYKLVDVFTSRGDGAALRAFEPAAADAVLVNQVLNERLVHRGDLDELAARARQGNSDATRRLAHVLGDRGDTDGAWRVLREAGEDRR